MSATARVLTVMARLGTFTVEDLAVRAGVSSATVHTVLRRNSSFIREIGVKPTGRPGGQLRRYQVDPEREVELRDALAKIRAGLLPPDDPPGEPAQLPVELAADPIWMPLSVPAAESILLDEFPDAPAEQRADLLRAADEYIVHARRALGSASEAEPTTPHLAAHLDLLDFARSVAEAELHPLGQIECRALLERWPELQWSPVGADAKSRLVKRLLGLVQAAAAKDAAEMPVDVMYSEHHGMPSLLDQALRRLKAMTSYSRIHIDKIQVRALNAAASIAVATDQPRLRVLAFDHASIRDRDPDRIIPAVAQEMGHMDELVVASEEMDSALYAQAVRHGATFMYLDSSDASCHVLQQGIDRAGERFVAESCRSAFGLALSSSAQAAPADAIVSGHTRY